MVFFFRDFQPFDSHDLDFFPIKPGCFNDGCFMSRQYQQSHGLLKCESSMREIQIPTTAKAHRIFHHLPGKNELRKKSVRFGDSTTQNSDIEKLTSHWQKGQKLWKFAYLAESPNPKIRGSLKSQLKNREKIVLRANFFPVGIGK